MHRVGWGICLLLAAAGAAAAGEVLVDGQPAELEVVDGDSVRVGGQEWRVIGYDTAEIERAACEGERRLGLIARRRLGQLIGGAQRVALTGSGERDRHRRPLGRLLIDGRDAGDIMVAEDLARPYNGGRKKGWCSRDSRDDLVPGPQPARRR